MPKLCPHCSVDLADGAKVCWHCHRAVDLSSAPDAPVRPKPEPKPKPVLGPPPPPDQKPPKPADYSGFKLALLIEAAILGVGLVFWKTGIMVLLGLPMFFAILVTLLGMISAYLGSRPELSRKGAASFAAYWILLIVALPLAAAIAFCAACLPMFASLSHL